MEEKNDRSKSYNLLALIKSKNKAPGQHGRYHSASRPNDIDEDRDLDHNHNTASSNGDTSFPDAMETALCNGAAKLDLDKKKREFECPAVEVDQDSSDPHVAWRNRLQHTVTKLTDVKAKSLIKVEDKERQEGTSVRSKKFLRFVCISDTHSRVERRTVERPKSYRHRVPDGDVLLHAGDFTLDCEQEEVMMFNEFLGQLPHKFKFVIPGNHEIPFDPRGFAEGPRGHRIRLRGGDRCKEESERQRYISLLTNAIYLEDTLVEFCGLKLYGVPWMPTYASYGFGMRRGRQLLNMYNLIPAGVDILLSHGPPVGIGDLTVNFKHVGCVELFNSIRQRIKPKFFVCGHIHEGYGIRSDGKTTYINAAICNRGYRPTHNPVVFDLQLPDPYTVDDFRQLDFKDLKLTNFIP